MARQMDLDYTQHDFTFTKNGSYQGILAHFVNSYFLNGKTKFVFISKLDALKD